MLRVVTQYEDFTHLSRRGQIRRYRRLAAAALDRYGIEPVSVALLSHFYNTTFVITDADGGRLVLHILRPNGPQARQRAQVASELWWLERLEHDLQLPVPVVVHTPEGEGVLSVADPSGANDLPDTRICTLFRWVDGRFLNKGLGPAHLEQVGRLTARLHNHSKQLTVPAGFERPRVDVVEGRTDEEVVRLFTDHMSPEAGRVIAATLQHVRQVQDELGYGPDVFGVIHADIHQKNYLFRDGEIRLIDFGDCGWGHHMYDLAVTLDQLRDRPGCEALRAALLAGYRQMRDLSPAHEEMIEDIRMVRQVQDVTWILEERDNPAYSGWTAQLEERVNLLRKRLATRQ